MLWLEVEGFGLDLWGSFGEVLLGVKVGGVVVGFGLLYGCELFDGMVCDRNELNDFWLLWWFLLIVVWSLVGEDSFFFEYLYGYRYFMYL